MKGPEKCPLNKSWEYFILFIPHDIEIYGHLHMKRCIPLHLMAGQPGRIYIHKVYDPGGLVVGTTIVASQDNDILAREMPKWNSKYTHTLVCE